jgi:hypothetical protein
VDEVDHTHLNLLLLLRVTIDRLPIIHRMIHGSTLRHQTVTTHRTCETCHLHMPCHARLFAISGHCLTFDIGFSGFARVQPPTSSPVFSVSDFLRSGGFCGLTLSYRSRTLCRISLGMHITSAGRYANLLTPTRQKNTILLFTRWLFPPSRCPPRD